MGVILGRRVKIVATLGPATSTRETLRDILRAGVDVARINAAHGSAEVRGQLIADVRAAAADLERRVPILFDLQGLKIRTGPLASGKDPVPIARGSTVEVYPDAVPTTEQCIGIGYPKLLEVVELQSRILISDGLIELLVERVEGDKLVCNVGRGGQLFGRQGVTLPGAPIRGGALTEADRADIAFALEQRVEYLGLSFVNDASDLVAAREATSSLGDAAPGLIAKIERGEALANVREIAEEADGLMVARGDLGVQLPPERVPRAQKEIIGVANGLGLPVITATQMLESMITQPVATRAETSDVANAVWDGTDAVMLSAETAMGRFPVEAVETMDRIIREIEKDGAVRSPDAARMLRRVEDPQLAFADAIARAAYALSDQTPASLIIVFTLAGSAARRVAKYRPGQQIIAVCTEASVASRLNLVWGVRSIVLPLEEEPDTMFRIAGRAIIDSRLAGPDEYALIVGSLPMLRVSGRTNLVHVRKLGT